MSIWWMVLALLAVGSGVLITSGVRTWLFWRADERVWREICERIAPHCRLYTWPDGTTEWIYTQPEEER